MYGIVVVANFDLPPHQPGLCQWIFSRPLANRKTLPVLVLIGPSKIELINFNKFLPQHLILFLSLSQQYFEVVDIDLILLFEL